MPIALKSKKQHLKLDGKEVIRYVAVADRGKVIPWDKVAEQIHLQSGANVHQIKSMMSSITDALCTYLSEGHSVQLAEFGTIMPTIHSTAVEKEKDIKADKVTVSFYPSGKLQRALKAMSVSTAPLPPHQQTRQSPSQTEE